MDMDLLAELLFPERIIDACIDGFMFFFFFFFRYFSLGFWQLLDLSNRSGDVSSITGCYIQ